MNLFNTDIQKLPLEKRLAQLSVWTKWLFLLLIFFKAIHIVGLGINYKFYQDSQYWGFSIPSISLFFKVLLTFLLFFLYLNKKIPILIMVFLFLNLLCSILSFSCFFSLPAFIAFLTIGIFFKILFLKEWFRYKASFYELNSIALFSQQ